MRSIQEITAELRKKPIERSFVIERDAMPADEESRTVNLAFASDTPVEHWFGTLELSMKGKAMRTDRLTSGAPLLMDHNTRDQVGVVENFTIDGGIARADVRFDTDQRSSDVFNSVKNGIRRNVSVGFMVHSMELTNQKEADKGAIPMYRSDDWEPYEISIVSVPADISVGVGRDANTALEVPETRAISTTTETTMKTAEEIAAEKAAAEAATRAAAPAVETRSTEVIAAERTKAIMEFAGCFGEQGTTIARTMIASSAEVTLDDVRTAIRAKIVAENPGVTPPAVDPATQAQREGGVPAQAIQLARSTSRVQLQAFKGEGAHERAYKCGMHLAAVLLRDDAAIRYCREQGIAMTRAQGEGSNTAGGFTVIPEFDETLFQLIIQYGVLRPNADVVPMNSDQRNVTRRTGGLTAYAVGNGQRGTYSQTTDDQFELIARKWMVLAKYEDELGEDSFINWADRLANEAGIALAYAEDNAGFNGDGTSTYHGIVGLITKLTAATAGVVTAAGATYASVTLANMTSLIGKLPQYARKSGNVKFYCSSSVWANVLERIALAANGTAYADIKGELTPVFAGKPVEIVEVMPTTEATGQLCIVYGNMSQAVTFGDRRGITVKMTDSNDVDFESDLHAVKVTERFDVNAHDVGDTSVAGPIVGLKLA